MPRPTSAVQPRVERLLAELGENIRLARRRRGLDRSALGGVLGAGADAASRGAGQGCHPAGDLPCQMTPPATFQGDERRADSTFFRLQSELTMT